MFSGIQGLVLVRKEIRNNTRRLFSFIITGLIGVPIGIALLDYIDAASLRVLVAVLLIVYGGYFSFCSTLPKFERATMAIDGSVGFIGGILGGSAVSIAFWCFARNLVIAAAMTKGRDPCGTAAL